MIGDEALPGAVRVKVSVTQSPIAPAAIRKDSKSVNTVIVKLH